MPNAKQVLKKVQLCADPYEVATGADALLLATKWNEFKQIDFTKIRKVMRQPIILDGRNIWDPELLRSLGFTYFGIGRGTQINNKQ